MKKYVYKVVITSQTCIYETSDKNDAIEMLKAYKEIDKNAEIEIRQYNETKTNGYIKII